MTSSADANELALQPTPNNGLVAQDAGVLVIAGRVANAHAARNIFADYLSRKADNTIRRQAADLARFAAFLNQAGEGAGLQLGAVLGAFVESVAAFPDGPVPDAEAWRGVMWGLVEAFRWSSLAMPRRYVEDSEIANEGMA